VHVVFWFLFFAFPVAAVAFVARVVLRLWRRGVAAMREVADVGRRIGEATEGRGGSVVPAAGARGRTRLRDRRT
jgi:membrane protein implicated in regulation of membrane protease activity